MIGKDRQKGYALWMGHTLFERCLVVTASGLPLRLVGLPPRRERRVLRGEGGFNGQNQTGRIIFPCVERMDQINSAAISQIK